MANDLTFEKHTYKAGDFVTATDMNRIEGLFEDIYEVLNTTPIIIGETESYLVRGNRLSLKFDVKNARGNIRYSISYQGAVIASGNSSDRSFDIDLGTRYQLGPNTYRLVIEDGMNKIVETFFKVTVLNMDFGFEDTNYPNFAVDLNESAAQQAITYEGQRIYFDAGTDYGDGVKVQAFYSYKNSTPIELQSDTLTIENSVYYWSFPVLNYTSLSNAQDDIFDIQFWLELKVEGQDKPISTEPITSVCYCLYGDNYKIIPTTASLNQFVDYQRTIVKAQLIAAGVAKNTTHKIVARLMDNNNELEAFREYSGIRVFDAIVADFGLLKAGIKTVEWLIDNVIIDTMTLEVNKGSGFIDHDLICYYNALSYNDGDKIWKPQLGQSVDGESWFKEEYFPENDEGNIRLHGLINYVEKNEKTNEPAHLCFNPDSYGIISVEKIMAAVNGGVIDSNTGDTLPAEPFTLEMFYKSEYAADNNAPVITSAKTFNDANSFSVTPFGVYSSLRQGDIKCAVSDSTWNHIALVLTPPIILENGETPVDSQADQENLYIAKLYYNGCLIGASNLTETKWRQNAFDMSNPIFSLNGYVQSETSATHTGISRINTIRIYKTGLTASEIMTNYISSVRACNEQQANELDALNANEKITRIFFMRNDDAHTPVLPNDGKLDKTTKEPTTTYLKGFDGKQGLHGIDNKDDRKKKAVNCSVYIVQKGDSQTTIQRLPNVDVWLQGTSSLAYPVKNYQIKNYGIRDKYDEFKGEKTNFLPYVVDATFDSAGEVLPGWNGSEGDYVYTLKCDYMDQSHRNNTPTAMYYDKVLNAVKIEVDDGKPLSPAKQDPNLRYRDSIQGFPVLVYYYNNSENIYDWQSSEYDPTTKDAAELIGSLESLSTPVGSYMFNVDKEGAALGFELDYDKGETITECTRYFPVEDYYFVQDNIVIEEKERSDEALPLQYYLRVQLDENDRIIPENDEDFMPLHQINSKDIVPYDFLECYAYAEKNNAYDIYSVGTLSLTSYKHGASEPYEFIFTPNENYDAKDSKLFYFSKMVKMDLGTNKEGQPNEYKSNFCISLEGTANSAIPAAATFYSFNEAARKINNGVLHPTTHDDYVSEDVTGNKIAYYALTLDPRWNGIEASDDAQQSYFDYYHLDKVIKYFRLFDQPDTNQAAIKKTFESLFDKTYCLTYFLQMMAFAQVDNAGKNAMFDCWGEGLIYPRPYDMDTQLGLENKGGDTVPVGTELFTHAVNDAGITIDWKGNMHKVPEDDILADEQTTIDQYAKDPNAYRLIWYNTRNSKLWSLVSTAYKEDIANLYSKLRDSESYGLYDADVITKEVNKLTSEKISGMQYNRDVYLKYLKQEDNFHMIAGDRQKRTQQFLTERFNFLDSIWNYNQETLITTVANSNTTTIHLQVKSPQYIHINLASSTYEAKFYVDPKMCYSDNDDRSGISIKLPKLSTDAEVRIVGSQGIVSLPDFGNIIPKKFNFAQVENLSKLDISASSNIQEFAPREAKYLTDIKFTNPSGDKTFSSLNFSDNNFLRTIDCSDNQYLTQITLPEPGVVSSLKLVKCPYLKKLVIKDLTNLTTSTLQLGDSTSPSAIEELEIDGCENLTTLNFATILPNLRRLVIRNCASLTSLSCSGLDNLQTLIVTNCQSLKTVNCASAPLLTNVDLRNNKSLDIVYAMSATKLKRLVLSASNDLENPQVYQQIMLRNCKVLDRVITDVSAGLELKQYDSKTALDKLESEVDKTKFKKYLYYTIDKEKYYLWNGKAFEETIAPIPELIDCDKLPLNGETEYIYFQHDNEKYYIWDVIETKFVEYTDNENTFNFQGLKIIQTSSSTDNKLGAQGFGCGVGSTTGAQTVVRYIKNLDYTGNGSGCFARCEALESFSNCKLNLKTTIESLFGECTALTSTGGIIFSKVPGSSIASFYFTFKDCGKLRRIYSGGTASADISNFIKLYADSTTIAFNYSFRGLSSLSSAQIFAADTFSGTRGNSITNFRDAFHGTKISEIKQGAFDGCTSIESVAGIFADCKNLTTIPDNLFTSPALNDLHSAFDGCTALSGLPIGLLPPTMNNISIDCRALFRNCSSLLSKDSKPELEEESKIGQLEAFLTSLPQSKISTLEAAFQNTGIKYLPDNLFDGFTSLKSAVAMFAKNTGLKELPNRLHSGVNENSTMLLDLGSLFCDCSNLGAITDAELEDFQIKESQATSEEEKAKIQEEKAAFIKKRTVIPANLFTGLKSRIQNLGLGSTILNADVSWYRNGFLGAFSGTKLLNCEEETFQDMTALTNISGLFADASLESTSATGYNGYRFYIKAKQNEKTGQFEVATGAFEGNSGEINGNMFKGCSNLRNVAGAFMGTKITGIDASVNYLFSWTEKVFDPETGEETGETITKHCPVAILDLLFASTNITQEGDAASIYASEDDPVQRMLNGLAGSVTSIAYLCANNTNIKKLYNINKNTNLTNVNGLYASNQLSTNDTFKIPESYFANCANTLATAKYVFANNAGLKAIEQEDRIQLDRNDADFEDYLIKWIDQNGKVNQLTISKMYGVIYNGYDEKTGVEIEQDQITSFSWQSSLRRFAITAGSTTLYSKVSLDNVNLQIILDGGWGFQDDTRKCKLYLSSVFNNEITQWDYCISGLDILFSDENQAIITIPNAHLGKAGFLHGIEEEPISTFFNKCYSLTSVEGMFINTGLEKIPETLFYAPDGKNFGSLTSLKSLFNQCSNGSLNPAFLSDSVLPREWLLKAQAVTDTAYMFAGYGLHASGQGQQIPEAFDGLQLTTAQGMFANTRMCENAIVSETFLQNSITNYSLSNASYLFACSPLRQFINPFGLQTHGITHFNYAFYSTLSNANYTSTVPNKNSRFASLEQSNYCWGNQQNYIDKTTAEYQTWKPDASNVFNTDSDFNITDYLNEYVESIGKYLYGYSVGLEPK